MAGPGPQTQAKRQRELAKKEKRQDKEERRVLRKKQAAEERNPSAPAAHDVEAPGTRPPAG
jgi:hypothetical protein